MEKIEKFETELIDKDSKSRYLGVYFRDLRLSLNLEVLDIAKFFGITEEEMVDIEIGERRFYRCETEAINKLLQFNIKITGRIKLLSGPVRERIKSVDAIKNIEIPSVTMKYSKSSKKQGILIQKTRRKYDLSLTAAANLLGVSFSDILSIENGELMFADFESAINAITERIRPSLKLDIVKVDKKDLVILNKSSELLTETKLVYTDKKSYEKDEYEKDAELRANRRGIKIKKARRDELSLEEVAEKLGITTKVLSAVEDGELEFIEHDYILDTIRNFRIEKNIIEKVNKLDGNYFCALRRRNNMTIKYVANLLRITVDEYSDVEDGKREFSSPCKAETAIKKRLKIFCKVNKTHSEQLEILINKKGLSPVQASYALGISKTDYLNKKYDVKEALEKLRKYK